MNPSNPGVKGVGEVLHDGMNDAGHEEQANRAGETEEKEEGDKE